MIRFLDEDEHQRSISRLAQDRVDQAAKQWSRVWEDYWMNSTEGPLTTEGAMAAVKTSFER